MSYTSNSASDAGIVTVISEEKNSGDPIQTNTVAENRNRSGFIQRRSLKRFTVWSVILHIFELMISPIILIRAFQVRAHSKANSCFLMLLGWSSGMLARLPFLIALETVTIHEIYRNPRMILVESPSWFGVYKFIIILQIVWCVLGTIGISSEDQCTDKEKLLLFWSVLVMSLNYVVMCAPLCIIVVQLMFGCFHHAEYPPVDSPHSSTIPEDRVHLIQFVEENKDDGKTARNTSHIQCCICMCEYKNTAVQKVAETGCNHRFHRVCLNNWYVQKQTCPICKSRIRWPLFV